MPTRGRRIATGTRHERAGGGGPREGDIRDRFDRRYYVTSGGHRNKRARCARWRTPPGRLRSRSERNQRRDPMPVFFDQPMRAAAHASPRSRPLRPLNSDMIPEPMKMNPLQPLRAPVGSAFSLVLGVLTVTWSSWAWRSLESQHRFTSHHSSRWSQAGERGGGRRRTGVDERAKRIVDHGWLGQRSRIAWSRPRGEEL